MENSVPSEGVALPYMVIGRSRGTTFSLTCSVPIGCTHRVSLFGFRVAKETPTVVAAGSAALQSCGFCKAVKRSGSTGFDGIVAWLLSPQLKFTDAPTVKNRKVMETLP